MEWVVDRRQQGIGISVVEIRLQAQQLAKLDLSAASFKASYGWARRFMGRNDLSVRRRTTLSQRLPDNYNAKLLNFQQFVLKLRKEHGYELAQLGNADQTPLTFDLPYERTVAQKVRRASQRCRSG